MMSRLKIILIVVLFFLLATFCKGQETVMYKQVDTSKLYLELRLPADFDESQRYPAMVFFFGGGWNGGDRYHLEEQANYFARRGIVCFLADYRTKKKHGVDPYECVKDAKSAIRFIRTNADQFSIDPGKIIASGGSAGGHLAAAAALIEMYNEDSDDLSVSCIPEALVLFNPVIDNGPAGYGYERIGESYKDFSPLHNVLKGAPPTIMFFGTNDDTTPVVSTKYYKELMESVGSRCELILYEDEKHGFFNYRNLDLFKDTVLKADEFLVSLNYLAPLKVGENYFKE